eukprot:TRINITY_DN54161_c0_g1_i1.p1 TRINITY_DN54161_c0_g1~~TRINITY_DN54161_c0_g1_i1.p1  ORF type:complete len:270 (-),score=35.45 TRINITY_DN54161_c0_g1_i1:11-793(-)
MVAYDYSFVYYYPWELLIKAYLRRFPTTPHIPCLLGCTVLEETENDSKTEKHIRRRMEVKPEVPNWVKKWTGLQVMTFVQELNISYERRSITIESKNEFLPNHVSVAETCAYNPHPERPEWCLFRCSGTLTIKSLYRMEKLVERLCLRQYLKNSQNGRRVDAFHINEILADEGPAHWPGLQPWGYDPHKPGLNQPRPADAPENDPLTKMQKPPDEEDGELDPPEPPHPDEGSAEPSRTEHSTEHSDSTHKRGLFSWQKKK